MSMIIKEIAPAGERKALSHEEAKAAKNLIRAEMREKRKAVKDDARRAAGKVIANNLANAPVNVLLCSQLICVYLSAKHEIPMHYFCTLAWDHGKDLCLPVWDEDTKCYHISMFMPQAELVIGKYGIREPAVRMEAPLWDVNAFVTPGLAFDRYGGRLGYGGGYFDRMLLSAAPRTYRIGVCFDWQLRDEPLPLEAHDQRLNWIVTDKRIVCCEQRKEYLL